ncbi:MAG TPA: hypothetical protein VK716_12970 [Terracidiphilus sp.]|nr:hypothetical protein [Terracidiphilus sp.]
MRIQRCFSFLAFIAVLICGGSIPKVGAQAVQKPALPELWAALPTKFDSDKVRSGDEVMAIVANSWIYGICGVSTGDVLKGHVVSLTGWTDATKSNSVGMRFEVPCTDGKRKPVVLIAVYYPEEGAKGQMDTFMMMPQGIGAGASGRQSTDIGSMPSPGTGPAANLPLAKMGEVKGVRHLSLKVGGGEQGSTVLESSDKRLHLDKGTRLAFVPVPETD